MSYCVGLSVSIAVSVTVSVCVYFPTFSPEAPVRTKVEKTGREYLVWGGQHSMVAPMGRQKRGTDSGSGKDS